MSLGYSRALAACTTSPERGVAGSRSRDPGEGAPVPKEVAPPLPRNGRASGAHSDLSPAGKGKDRAADKPQAEWVSGLAKSSGRWMVRLLALAAGLALWQYASATSLNFYVRFDNVPGPLQVGQALLEHLQQSTFYLHVGASLRRIAISYSLAAGIGITLGLLMGRSRLVRDIVYPYIELLRPIPAVAWIPLAILLWPTEALASSGS